MLLSALLFAIATEPASIGDKASLVNFDPLLGCWNAPGKVMGESTDGIARVTKRLEGRYYLLELHGADENEVYDAAIVIAFRKNGTISSYWMDSFGADGSALGEGIVHNGSAVVNYQYPDALFTNRFERANEGWRWTIDQTNSAGVTKRFAEYELTTTSCAGQEFKF